MPGRCVRGDQGDQGIPRHHRQHLLEEHLPARPLDGSFETVLEAQLVHAVMIPGQASAPLPLQSIPIPLRNQRGHGPNGGA